MTPTGKRVAVWILAVLAFMAAAVFGEVPAELAALTNVFAPKE